MPRQARLDAPGTLYHVMVRGLERRAIFPDDRDRAAFLNRLAVLADSGPSRSTPGPCSRITPTSWCGPGRTRCPGACALLTPSRGGLQPPLPPRGPLFQIRYTSIVVEADPSLLGTAQTRAAVRARQLFAYVWVEHLGRRASELARALGQSRGNVSLAAKRGTAHAAAWRAQIADWCR